MADISEVLRALREGAIGAGEVGLSLGTGMLAQPVAGLRGLFERSGEDAAKEIERTSQALTYEPRTDIGRRGLENIGYAIEPVLSKLREKIADPMAGAGLIGMANLIGPRGAKPKQLTLPGATLRTGAQEVAQALRAKRDALDAASFTDRLRRQPEQDEVN